MKMRAIDKLTAKKILLNKAPCTRKVKYDETPKDIIPATRKTSL